MSADGIGDSYGKSRIGGSACMICHVMSGRARSPRRPATEGTWGRVRAAARLTLSMERG